MTDFFPRRCLASPAVASHCAREPGEPEAREQLQPRPVSRRVGVISLRVAGVIAAVVAASIGAVMLILQTRWGGERLRRQLVARVNHQIRESWASGRLSFGGDRLTVWDLPGLRDPDGNQVAQVARAEVDFRLGCVSCTRSSG